MDTYISLLSSVISAILGRFTYIGSNISSYPMVLYIIGVSVVLETFLMLRTLMKGD